MALTAKQIARLRLTPGLFNDGHGLYLQVENPNNVSWLFRYQRAGRKRWMGLGPLHTVGLAEARERAKAARLQLLDGSDPLEVKRAARVAQTAAAAKSMTFGEAAEIYYRNHMSTWSRHHAGQWRSAVLGKTCAGKTVAAKYDHCRSLRSLSVAAVDTAAVIRIIEPIWHSIPDMAGRVRARIEAVLSWATAGGFRSGDNPASWEVIQHLLPKRSAVRRVKHHPALPYRELPAFMAELRQQTGIAARALELVILCAARSGEVLGAKWSEFDLEERLWTIPPERMKNRKEHRVPLSDRALEILRSAYRETDNPFVFIGTRRGRGLGPLALAIVLKRMERTDVTTHGFRSTFSDWCHETTGYSNHAIEISLAHSVGSDVEKAYRRGDQFVKRVRLMEDWAAYCASPPVRQTDNAPVPMRGRAR